MLFITDSLPIDSHHPNGLSLVANSTAALSVPIPQNEPVTICLGTKDAVLAVSADSAFVPFHQFADNLDTVIQRCKERNCRVRVIAPQVVKESPKYTQANTALYVDQCVRVAHAHGLSVLPGTMQLFHNAHFWDWGTKSFVQGWLLVDDGVILATSGTAAEPAACDGPFHVESVDLQGRYVLPGLGDAHMHTYLLGETQHQVNFAGCTDMDEFKRRLEDFSAQNPDFKWITGVGWDHEAIGRLPTMDDIDAVVPDRPVFLWRSCWHVAVANRKAFAESDIDLASPPHIDGGSLDPATGILREQATQHIKISECSPQVARKYVVDGLRACVENGLTSIQTNDAMVSSVFQDLDAEDALPVRVHLTVPASDVIDGSETSFLKPYAGRPDKWNANKSCFLVCDRVKIFSDGSLGAGTAAIRGGYAATNGANDGMLIHEQSALEKMVVDAHAKGFRLETHAIGDLAAEKTLDAYEAAGVAPKDRPVLTHAQVLGPDLVPRMARMGVIADVQPSFVPTDAAWVRKRLNPSKIEYSYCWKTMLHAGIQVVGSSDAPIESINPFEGMHDAIFRRERGPDGDVFLPDECLDFAEALQLYTLGVAFAAGVESHRGRLEPGYDADFTVVTTDVSKDLAALKQVSPAEVWVDGRRTFSAADSATSVDNPQRSPFIPGKAGQALHRAKRFNPMMCRCSHKK